MKLIKVLGWLSALAILVSMIGIVPAGAQTSGGFTRQIPSSGTSSFQAGPTGVDGLQWPEFAGGGSSEQGPVPFKGNIVDRSESQPGSNGASVNSGQKAKSNPELNLSFNGLNLRQQRLANGGNQFTVEPPDQALCAGNGSVLESVNDVLRVFDTSGNALTGVTDLNTFYGYPPQIIRATGAQGPFVTDPVCYFDTDTQRFFLAVLTLDQTTAGDFTGPNHLDLAVSNTSDPTGAWTIYRIPVQNDGTDGTPNHGCSFGPCIGDYPHIGADANGIYLTTNEYSLFGPEYKSANIYALSKAQLAAGAPSVTMVQFDTVGAVNGNPGFTVWPAISPAGIYETGAGGTEYFLSSNAADEANGTGSSTDLVVWSLTNTSSLSSSSPALTLSNKVLTVGQYGIPPKSDQKVGNYPLGQSLGEPESQIDSNDTRMQQVMFSNGKLWGALDTALTINGANKAGIEWFIVKPDVSTGSLNAKVAKQGYLGLANNNLTYPAIGVTPSGRGVMAFTVVGADYYPSAGYAAIDAVVGAGPIHIAAQGAGPDDGFTGYGAFVGFPPRTRWGDYGAASVVGNSVWIASEYIAQTCTLAQYQTAPVGSCGGTRVSFGNWATRISKVTP